MSRAALIVAFASVLGLASTAGAQSPAVSHGLTLAGGIVWSGSYSIGEGPANLRQSAPGADPPPFALFQTESSLGSAIALEGRVGVALSPSLSIEGAVSWSQPDIHVVVTDDVENGSPELEPAPASQYIIEASLVWKLPVVQEGARLRPYVLGGGGYLRQLYEDRTLVENGQIYHFGGGAEYLLRGVGGTGRPVGIRGDLRAYVRKDGIELEGKVRAYPAVSASMFVRF